MSIYLILLMLNDCKLIKNEQKDGIYGKYIKWYNLVYVIKQLLQMNLLAKYTSKHFANIFKRNS